MTKFKTFPRTNIHVIDQSAENVYIPEELPLHRPLFVGFAEQGVGMGYGIKSDLEKKFGEGTFDSKSKWFNNSNFFLRTAASNQPVFFYRLIPPNAKTGSLVIEAHVWDDEIIQYQRDSSGRYLKDINNNIIPIIDLSPIINNITWDDDNHTELSTRVLTISASDVEHEDLSYSVQCSDTNVTITQDSMFDNMFNITYPDYSSARVENTFTITVTDNKGNSTATELIYIVNPSATDAVFGYYWNDKNHKNGKSYTLDFIVASGTNSMTVSVIEDDTSNINIVQDSGDFKKFTISYGDFDPYPHDITYTFTGLNTVNSNTNSFTNNKSVEEFSENTTPYTQNGIKIEWRTRELLSTENMDTLNPSTYVNGTKTVTIYPIFVFKPVNGQGSYANNMGVKLYWRDDADKKTIEENQALFYTIELVNQPYGFDSPVVIRDFYGSVYNDFMFKPDAINKDVDMSLDFNSIMENMYRDRIPYEYKVYSENVKIIGSLIKNIEVNIPEITNEYMANIFEAISTDGVPYYYTEIVDDTSTSALIDKDIVHYLSGGDDGDITDSNFEELTKEFFSGNLFPEIKDKAKWPINHIYDVGYELDTKYALLDMLSLREDVYILLSTQTMYTDYNTEAEDQSATSALRIRSLLYPESQIDGTNACRVSIYMQACRNNFDESYKRIIPMTMKGLLSRTNFHNSTFIKGEWKGLPNSSVDFIKEINWAPYSDDTKQLHWDTAGNYCQYYDMTRLHYPDIITVYSNLTSVLSSDTYVTYLIYLKQLIQRTWAKYAGLEEPVSLLKYKIEKDLNDSIYRIFKNYIKVIPSVYQTDQDKALGYAMTVELGVYDSVAKRIWNVPIYCRRIESLQA